MWQALLAPITSLIGKAIDRAVPDRDQAERLKAQITAEVLTNARAELEGAVKIILAEASGNWLQRTWRPLLMLTFASLIVARWLGYTAPGITEALELKLFEIVQLGIGGYVLGRTAEKVADKLGGMRGSS